MSIAREYPPYGRAVPGGRQLRVGVLVTNEDLERSESSLIDDLLQTEYVSSINILVKAPKATLRLAELPELVIHRTYATLDRALTAGRRYQRKTANDYASAGSAVSVSRIAQDLPDQLRRMGLDVILCPGSFHDVEPFARLAREGVWWIARKVDDRGEGSDRTEPLVSLDGNRPLLVCLLAQSGGNSTPTLLGYALTPFVSRYSSQSNIELFSTLCRNLWFPNLWALHRQEPKLPQRPSADDNFAVSKIPNPASAWQLPTIPFRAVRNRLKGALGPMGTAGSWHVGLRNRRVASTALLDASGYQWIKSAPGTSLADPFFLSSAGKTYLFMEEFELERRKGRIVCTEIDESGGVGEFVPVLERKYHISYPQIFEHGGEIFMMPETGFNGTIELYRATNFPFQWELVTELFRGPAFDATILRHEDRFWLFVPVIGDRDRYAVQLLLYSAPELTDRWQLHPSSPLTNDARYARGAGRILSLDSTLIRPAQDCGTVYGGAINLRRISVLNELQYSEEAYGTLSPSTISGATGIHTYSWCDKWEAIDCRFPASQSMPLKLSRRQAEHGSNAATSPELAPSHGTLPPRRPAHRSRAHRIKCFVLRACATVGLFRLSGALFRRRLHILCYHGFEVHDECHFRPQLFISRETFESRLNTIVRRGFKVLPLGDALTQLWAGTLPPRTLVITIDDGFRSTLHIASHLLRRFEMPATVYVTTYYVEKEAPVFRLAVQYVFWRADTEKADWRRLGPLMGDRSAPAQSQEELMWRLIRHGEAMESEAARQQLLAEIANTLAVDLSILSRENLLTLLSAAEVQQLALQGFDIQLHTHRHRFPPDDQSSARREIRENRSHLSAITGRSASHFCYPSGIFSPTQWPWLPELGVESATTCLPGLNSRRTPPYGLRRFLDSEAITSIEFEAELAGFNELLRMIKRIIAPKTTADVRVES